VAEQNNEFLMKNHKSHPSSSKPFPEMNETFIQKIRKNQRYRYEKNKWKKRRYNPSKVTYHNIRSRDTINPNKKMVENLHKHKDKCHRCGIHGHCFRTCHTPKHLTDLYQSSLEQNAVETNFINKDDFEGHNAYLDVNDFFKRPYKTDNMLSGRILEDN